MSLTEIRKELIKEQSKQDNAEKEAAMAWLQENVIPLNEGVDRETLAKLISVIQKFDEKLSVYSDKLPTVATIISNAENELNQVVTGSYRSKKKTAELLQNLTSVYNHLSDIFKNRLKLVIATPLFKRAREFEDLPIKAVDGLDYGMAYAAFKQAVKPSTIQLKLWGKIIPKAQYEQMCKEFCDMSYKDLVNLCSNVPKVPVVIPTSKEEESEEPIQMAAEAGAMASGAVAGGPAQPVALQQETPMSSIMMEQLDPQAQQMIQQSATTLQNLIKSIKGKGLEKVEGNLANLLKALRTEMASGKLGNSVKQTQQVINIFTAIRNALPKINNLFVDGDFDDEDKETAKKLFLQAANAAQNQTLKEIVEAKGFYDPMAPVQMNPQAQAQQANFQKTVQNAELDAEIERMQGTNKNSVGSGATQMVKNVAGGAINAAKAAAPIVGAGAKGLWNLGKQAMQFFKGTVTPYPGLDANSIVNDILDSVGEQIDAGIKAEGAENGDISATKQFFTNLQKALSVGLKPVANGGSTSKIPPQQAAGQTGQVQQAGQAQTQQQNINPQLQAQNLLDQAAKLLNIDSSKLRIAAGLEMANKQK